MNYSENSFSIYSSFKNSKKLQTIDGEILVDYSKNILNEDIMKALFQLVSAYKHILSIYISG
jgi:hypothetical protein